MRTNNFSNGISPNLIVQKGIEFLTLKRRAERSLYENENGDVVSGDDSEKRTDSEKMDLLWLDLRFINEILLLDWLFKTATWKCNWKIWLTGIM